GTGAYPQETVVIPKVEGSLFSDVVSQKRDLYKKLLDSSFDEKNYGSQREMIKMLSGGLKETSEELAERARTGLGKEVADVNKKIGSLLNVEDVAAQEARKTMAAKPLGAVGVTSFAINPSLGLAKQIGGFTGSAALGKTSTGMGAAKLGQVLA